MSTLKQKKFIDAFWKRVKQADKILLTSHVDPDEDAIASVLLMRNIILKKFPAKRVDILYAPSPLQKWSYIKETKRIKMVEDVAQYYSKYELAIVLDGSQYHRFAFDIDQLGANHPKVICIDHHSNEHPDKFGLTHISPKHRSNTHLLYDLFLGPKKVTAEQAELILIGLLRDSGFLRTLGPDDSQTWADTAFLVKKARFDAKSYAKRLNTLTAKQFEGLQLLTQRVRKVKAGKWLGLISYFEQKEEKGFGFPALHEAGMTFTGRLGDIEGADFVLILYPKGGTNTVFNFKTLTPELNAAHLAAKIADKGGGHPSSAGGTFFDLDVEQAKRRFINEIKKIA